MDALAAMVAGLALRARLFYVGGLCGRWAVDHNSDAAIWFHLVTKGCGWVHSAIWSSPLKVQTGDLVLFMPHARKHYLSYSPDEVRFDDPEARMTSLEEGSTGFVCGVIELLMPKALMWQALPAEIVIHKNEAGDTLAHLIELIVTESCQARFASATLIERLCDGLLLLVLRHCVERGYMQQGVFVALGDRRLGKALSLLHEEPEQPWTVQRLGAAVGLSKTALTEKFDKLIGCPPIEYLTQWRMQLAATWLKDSAMTVEQIAGRCGYHSLSAFTNAFKRSCGVAPGQYRRGVAPRQ